MWNVLILCGRLLKVVRPIWLTEGKYIESMEKRYMCRVKALKEDIPSQWTKGDNVESID